VRAKRAPDSSSAREARPVVGGPWQHGSESKQTTRNQAKRHRNPDYLPENALRARLWRVGSRYAAHLLPVGALLATSTPLCLCPPLILGL
jgi:hypothetical protein